MKTAKYKKLDGSYLIIEYDENAACICCGEPVGEASMGGTSICPACDCGKCRYCGVDIVVVKEEIDGGRSKRNFLEHIVWHKKQRKNQNDA
jgi:hypothetical protein